MIDFYGTERHFCDHGMAVWRALPDDVRGQFITSKDLVEHVRSRGVETSSGPAVIDTSHAVLVASYGDLKRARRLGYSRFAYLEHGAGQSYAGEQATASRAGYAGGCDHDDVGLFLVPGEYPASRWRAAYPKARVVVVGSPKVDALPRLDPSVPRGTVALGFHWQAGVTQETRTAFAWYRPVLFALGERFHLIGHGHPRGISEEPHWPRAYSRLRIEWVPEFEEVCRRASVYVCDNSSTLLEFAATGRPVVVLNAPFYRKGIQHGGRFWDWATVGPQVDRTEDLAAAVALALEDSPAVRAERERVVDLVYGHRGDAAEHARDAIAEWLGVRSLVAA